MRTSLAAAAFFLLAVQPLTALAGESRDGEMLPCAVMAGQTALPAGLCQHIATVLLAPASRIDFAGLLPADPAGPLLAQFPVAKAPSPMAPAASLATNDAWQSQLDSGVASYGQIFTGQGLAYTLPAAPNVFWPGGDPFALKAAD